MEATGVSVREERPRARGGDHGRIAAIRRRRNLVVRRGRRPE